MTTIDEKLKKLAERMANMANNDMGDLTEEQAELFHSACDAIDALIHARESQD